MNSRYALVSARAGHRCEYCHAPEAIFNFPFEVEHALPPGQRWDRLRGQLGFGLPFLQSLQEQRC